MKKTWEIWNDILEKPSEELTETERIVNRVNYFLFNFESGGWLYNLSPAAGTGRRWSELRDAADAVETVGAPQVANALRSVADIFEQVDVQHPGTWNEFLAQADPKHARDEWEQLISQEIPELWTKLDKYTLANFECVKD